jgi:aminoglycoside phosphotransferase (APT) family kinase protein
VDRSLSVPVSSDSGLDVHALQGFLRDHGVPTSGELTATLVSGGRSNLTYVVDDAVSSWVLRRPPMGAIPAGSHDVAREFRVMSALAHTPVPVPRTVVQCEDVDVIGARFYLMERIDGRVLRTKDDVAELDLPTRARLGNTLIDTLIDLHDVDVDAVGLSTLGRPTGYLERQVQRWATQYRAVRFRELPHVDHVLETLRSHLPQSPPPSIVHGDYRLDNVITVAGDPGRIAGVLDWEMATIGDPLADLGMLLMFWDEPGHSPNPITAGLMAAPGFPRRDDVVERYVSRRGLRVDDLDWYLVFCEFKLAVILEQIHARFVSGDTVGTGFDGVGAMVGVLLDSAFEHIRTSPAFV